MVEIDPTAACASKKPPAPVGRRGRPHGQLDSNAASDDWVAVNAVSSAVDGSVDVVDVVEFAVSGSVDVDGSDVESALSAWW